MYKFTQKLRQPDGRFQQGYITTIYITKTEYELLAQLPARTLAKTRFSVPPFGIDVFEDLLAGLIIAEAEFDSAENAASLALPPFILHEVSEDDRFTGGRLCEATREELRAWLSEYGTRGTANG